MADWVKCKSATDATGVVYVNLDQAISVVVTSVGTEVTYAGQQDCVLLVASTPDAMLTGVTVRDAT
jgi:hypothetical protein